MEWGFYSVKPATGGEGVRPGYTTATTTHYPPQTFFRQLAPFALAHHRRHVTFPYVRQDTSQPCAAAGLARYTVVSVAGFLFPHLAHYIAVVYRRWYYDQVHTKRKDG